MTKNGIITMMVFIISVINSYELSAQIKSIKTTSKSSIDGKSHVSEFKKYNKKKNLIKLDNYDSDGKLESRIEYIYVNDKLILKSDINFDFNEKEITKIKYDTILNNKTTKVFRNEKLAYGFIETYDKDENIIKIVQDIKGDIVTVKYSYLLNDDNKVISVTDETKNLFKTFKYDSLGNEVEVIKYGTYLTYKTLKEFKKGKIHRILKTRITKDSTEYVDSDITYDDFFNPIYQKIYNDKKLIREHKRTYTFDKKGNWVTKTVTTKDYIFDRSNTFKPNYIETRKIKYW
ncbi:hypothetical protein [Aurantibacter sp.]|uniref:hypothetical protein n=1 Tax=Aurantibacter sp. TaxID=2807103 RepID=UPI0035C85C6A